MSKESRLDVRAQAHLKQCYYYQRLIKILHPDWFKSKNDDLAFADTEECPLNAIHNIFHEADKSWENQEDYHAVIEEMSERCSKALQQYEEKLDATTNI